MSNVINTIKRVPTGGIAGQVLSKVDATNFNTAWVDGGAVMSVAGRAGDVVLAKADVGLSNVDNTADMDKPVSTAQATAIDLKANKLNPTITGLNETSITMAANDIDLSLGNHFKKTISGNITFTISNVPATGNLNVFILELTNAGAYTVTFPTIQWELLDGSYSTNISTYLAANAPRSALKASGVDSLIFWVSNGATIYGKFL